MAVESTNTSVVKAGHQDGFTLMQLVIVVLVIGVVGALAVMGIAQARQRIRLTNSARLLASYLEKARVDSIRRHATTDAEMAGLIVLSTTSYQVRYDMDGNGALETRDIQMDEGVHFVNDTIPTRFDWRGRFISDLPTDTKTSFTLQYGDTEYQCTVDVTRSGDVTIDAREYLDDVPNVNVNTNLNEIDSGSTVNGNSNSAPTPTPDPSPTAYPSPTPDVQPTPTPDPTPVDPGEEPTPTPYPTPGASPTPTPSPSPTPDPTPAPCVVDIAPPALSIRKNGGFDTLTFTVTGGSGAVSYTSGPTNLEVTQTSTSTFRVLSTNNSRGDFTLYFSTPCGSRQVVVTVTN